MAGELLMVTSDCNPNCLKEGSSHRREGIFLSNYVMLDTEGEEVGWVGRQAMGRGKWC